MTAHTPGILGLDEYGQLLAEDGERFMLLGGASTPSRRWNAHPDLFEVARLAMDAECIKGGDATEDLRGCECSGCRTRSKARAAIAKAVGK